MVLVSHKYKFIYLKTRKTGSTSVDAFFEQFCIPDEEVANFKIKHGAVQKITDAGIVGSRFNGGKATDDWRNHKPANVVRDLLGEEKFNAYFKFTVIRNPWDKAVSLYHYHKGAKHGSFIDFIAKNMLERLSVRERGKHSIDWYIHSLEDKPICNRYLRFETLREDVEQLCKDLKLQNYTMDAFPHYKKSNNRPHYSEFYKKDGVIDEETVNHVKKFYAKEVDYFGYVFETQ